MASQPYNRDEVQPEQTPRQRRTQTPIWLSVLWYIFVGWWVAIIWDAVAWFLAAIVITMPTAVSMLDATPYVMTLHTFPEGYRRNAQAVVASVRANRFVQRNIVLRFFYWLFIGWWFSAFWIAVGYLATLIIVTIPFAFQMFNAVPLITTLQRY